ncbi:MAG TPA: alpha/beta hydrolase [Sphingomonas bacterium]|uniref:Alpha/beta hydrolase n=1 Tax=Sphingomonas bacterium TaxID=1895847 RepID=A0A3D0WBK8_9SPHN|nr:alpha/beta hydrolase [Sphingomonas bacterium]
MSLRWSVEGRDWPNREHNRFVTQGALRWHVQVMGNGPPLLLLHGTGAATHSWRDLAPLLAEHYTLVMPDLPGHGFSTGRPPGGMAMPPIARAIGGLLEAIEVEPHAIVGHSAGAAVAARIALDGIAAPRTIVGLGAALLPFPGLAAALFPTLAKLLFVNPFAPHLFAQMARMQGETARFVVRATGSTIEPAGVAFYERLLRDSGHVGAAIAMMADWDLEALKRDLPRLAPPLRLIHGERDAAIPIATAKEAAGLVPDGRTTGLPALGHLAHEERPGEVAALILAALKEAA